MPNLPSWLSSIINPDSIDPLEPNGGNLPINLSSVNNETSEAEAIFNPDRAIPSDAPEIIKDMARNVADILTNIYRIRGKRQSLITTAILTIAQNGLEVEKLACSLIDAGTPQHHYMHLYHLAISEALHKLVSLLEEEDDFSGLADNMNILTKRINADYHDKMNGGPK